MAKATLARLIDRSYEFDLCLQPASATARDVSAQLQMLHSMAFSAALCIGHTRMLAFGVVDHAIKVLDVTQAVTPKLKGVGCESQAIVHDIKGTLVLEGMAGVAIGHNDFHHGGTVHDGPHMTTILIPTESKQLSCLSLHLCEVRCKSRRLAGNSCTARD